MTLEDLEKMRKKASSMSHELYRLEKDIEKAELEVNVEMINLATSTGVHFIDISETFRLLRYASGMTQQQVADASGFGSTATVSHIESGRNNSIPAMEKMAHAMGYDLLLKLRKQKGDKS